mmetsp:Transcript_80281/g.233123  ORF Transcript_80281/g.233123 Transcript_80281/m.233123 type:complete len:284 (+) Transcript_80281:473-1324(+)
MPDEPGFLVPDAAQVAQGALEANVALEVFPPTWAILGELRPLHALVVVAKSKLLPPHVGVLVPQNAGALLRRRPVLVVGGVLSDLAHALAISLVQPAEVYVVQHALVASQAIDDKLLGCRIRLDQHIADKERVPDREFFPTFPLVFRVPHCAHCDRHLRDDHQAPMVAVLVNVRAFPHLRPGHAAVAGQVRVRHLLIEAQRLADIARPHDDAHCVPVRVDRGKLRQQICERMEVQVARLGRALHRLSVSIDFGGAHGGPSPALVEGDDAPDVLLFRLCPPRRS